MTVCLEYVVIAMYYKTSISSFTFYMYMLFFNPEGIPSLPETGSPYYIPGLESDLQVNQALNVGSPIIILI